MTADCPFCAPDPERVFHAGETVLGLWDRLPASPGHALLVTRRHLASWFEATEREQVELLLGVGHARRAIEKRHSPDGYNVGLNVGAAAGQTVLHLHLHVIPRYVGDHPDPRGGVRHALPDGRGYPVDRECATPAGAPAGEGSSPGPTSLDFPPLTHASVVGEVLDDALQGSWPLVSDAPHARALIAGGADPLLPHVLAHLSRADRADLAVAFVLRSGIALLAAHLAEFLQRGGRLRLLTGDYLGVTDPEALMRLIDLRVRFPARADLRVFEAADATFHPKSYLFHDRRGGGVALVGSSNLTRPALTDGVEWNYRTITSSDRRGFDDVVRSFAALFSHPRTRDLDGRWVEAYRDRRSVLRAAPAVDLAPPEEAAEPPAEPHEIQVRALAALEATRREGNSAGLVVLATGLGKTWLAAFDSVRCQARRVLFVAHHEEILQQALATFRRIRPHARLGLYSGQEKAPDADVVFASIQTLSRLPHLRRFARDAFDYMVVDEFHHAAATTYRRVIDHFDPGFLLGLTATPERTDGGDLLALCQENLVYRCDLNEGIDAGLLSPFHYFGVPDAVDYRNIPWRSRRFDEEQLTAAVATQARARNALDEWSRRGGQRTLAFCCSRRHADFMREFFVAAGHRAAAVHSGETSDPRARSLESLERGELDIVFAVDMFNEGVDVPLIDTIMMLRPTESRIVWLQQFGRGLRRAEGKERVTVIDYIGNHRTFLLKPQTLFSLPPGDAHVASMLNLLDRGEAALPAGCEVTYETEAVDILRGLLRRPRHEDALRYAYEDLRERTGQRPTASEMHHEAAHPRLARAGHGSWLRFVQDMGDLADDERAVLDTGAASALLDQLETTQMTRSYKMLVLRAMLEADRLPGRMTLDELGEGVRRAARASARLKQELGDAFDEAGALTQLLKTNPVAAWVGGAGTGGHSYFSYADGVFATTFTVPGAQHPAFVRLASELVDWRLAEYLDRSAPDVDPAEPGADDDPASVAAESRLAPFEIGRPYQRQEIPPAVGLPFVAQAWNRGYVRKAEQVFLLVTLEKQGMPDGHRYADRFLDARVFEWKSQRAQHRQSPSARRLADHQTTGLPVYLFVRKRKIHGGQAAPFVYCGQVSFVDWEGDRPITMRWRLERPLTRRMAELFEVPLDE